MVPVMAATSVRGKRICTYRVLNLRHSSTVLSFFSTSGSLPSLQKRLGWRFVGQGWAIGATPLPWTNLEALAICHEFSAKPFNRVLAKHP
jgi:hypothetical protein